MNGSEEAFRYTYSANKCLGCGQSPDISKTEIPMFYDSPAYEMYCRRCQVTSGQWPNPEEARWSWDILNPIRKTESTGDILLSKADIQYIKHVANDLIETFPFLKNLDRPGIEKEGL